MKIHKLSVENVWNYIWDKVRCTHVLCCYIFIENNGITENLLFFSLLAFAHDSWHVAQLDDTRSRGLTQASLVEEPVNTFPFSHTSHALRNIPARVFCACWRQTGMEFTDVCSWNKQHVAGEHSWSSATEPPRGFSVFCASKTYSLRRKLHALVVLGGWGVPTYPHWAGH